MIRRVLVLVVPVAVVAVAVAAILDGVDGALGSLLGGTVAIVFFASTPLLLTPVVRASTVLSPVAALGFFTLKSIAVVGVLAVLFDVGGVAERVDSTALGLTLLTVSLAWTAAHVIAFRNHRTPTYDLPSDPS